MVRDTDGATDVTGQRPEPGHSVTSVPNEAQIQAWDGPGGEKWATHAERFDRINRGYTEHILRAAAPAPGEHVLDVGCGNGALTLAIAPVVAPEGSVTGLDISGPMLATAARRAGDAGADNVELVKGDAQVEPLTPGSFDLVVSRFGVMFFDDPLEAFTNLARALRAGGRAAFSCWRDLLSNDWIMVPVGAALEHVPMPELGEPGQPGPFSLADPERLRSILGGAGFADIELDEVTVPMVIGTDLDDALSFLQATDLSAALFEGADPSAVARAWDAIRAALEPYATPDGVVLSGRAWIVTARR